MLKINKKLEYALIVLKHFSSTNKDTQVTARMICDLYNTPFDTTAKVMQVMNNRGILTSSQGVKGGYKVGIDLSQLSYKDLAQIIEGKSFEHNCSEAKCNLIESCNISGPIQKLSEYLDYFFAGLSVKELLEERPGPQSLLFSQTQLKVIHE